MQVFESAEEFSGVHAACGVTIGKYDGIHLGHRAIIAELVLQCRALAVPAVVILSEPQPEEFFRGEEAPVRLSRFEDKVRHLAALGVDAVVKLRFDTAMSQTPAEEFIARVLVASLGARTVVVGHDFCFGRDRRGNVAMLTEHGARQGFTVSEVPALQIAGAAVSSTRVRSLLETGDCHGACSLLGNHYNISGEVITGRQLGRDLGFPTANVALEFSRLPLSGVFAVCVRHPGGISRGVANAGVRPTVEQTQRAHLETHLFCFDRDLYGSVIEVSFLHRLRGEQKFDSVTALQAQIANDVSEARAWFWKGEASVV